MKLEIGNWKLEIGNYTAHTLNRNFLKTQIPLLRRVPR